MRSKSFKAMILIGFVASAVSAQTTNTPLTASSPVTNAPSASLYGPYNAEQYQQFVQHSQQVRENCIQGRRSICGKILQVAPGGLVVDSGYTNLMREPLMQSWLVPGIVSASRASHLIESREPDSTCIGLIFISDLPKLRHGKPKTYDYVIIEGYPAGQYTYKSVGTVERTIRRFSASLPDAVRYQLEAESHTNASASNVK